MVEDLASRNGVLVNHERIEQPHLLQHGDRLQVAGFEMRFTHDLTQWPEQNATQRSRFSPARSQEFEDQATQDDIELGDALFPENEPEWLDVVSRPASRNLLPGETPPASPPGTPPGSSADSLLQMAFAMGRLECPGGDWEPASVLLLKTLAGQLPAAEIGLYLFAGEHDLPVPGDLPMPRHVHQREGRRYRRPPESLVRQIRAPGASALLARNVVGDRSLASEDTRGEIDVESIVLVPLHLPITPSRSSNPPRGKDHAHSANGLLHVITAAGDRSLDERDLTVVITACEIFSEACRSLHQRSELQQTLDRSRQTIGDLRKQLAGRVQILGKSEAITRVQYQIAQVARSSAAVMLRGESGTGKELVASAIHFASARADEPLICLNCAALSKDLLESELFGHEKGAFTGATEQKKGKFEAASGGTLMLDEIGEMDLDLQAKLLRVLEGHPFERVGGQVPVDVDVRVIAATHRDLQAMVGQGKFRQDLFYRLNVIEIVVPPLRERGRDILLLAHHFVTTFVHAMGRGPMKLSGEAQQKLLDYSWPGNVRELRNVIERAVVMAPLDSSAPYEIETDELQLTRAVYTAAGTPPAAPPPTGSGATAPISLAQLEQQHIEAILRSTGGNKSKAAAILGIERSTLDRKLKRYIESASPQ